MTYSTLGDAVYTQLHEKKEDKKEDKKGSYTKYAKKMPSLIRFNGLYAALKYLQDMKDVKNDKDAEAYLENFFNVVGDESKRFLAFRDLLPIDKNTTDKKIDFIFSCDGNKTRLLTQLAHAQAEWFKRFAEANND